MNKKTALRIKDMVWDFKGNFSEIFSSLFNVKKGNSLLISLFLSLIDVSTLLLDDFGQIVVLK